MPDPDENRLSPVEYRLITSDIVVFGGTLLGMIMLAMRWAGPEFRSSLWLLFVGSAAALLISLTLWIGSQASLVRLDHSTPPWRLVAAISLISIGPPMVLVGALAWQEVESWFATPLAVGCWLLLRTALRRRLERHNGTFDVLS